MNDALACGLGVPFGLAQKKLDFLDSGMLQRFAVERFLFDRRIPAYQQARRIMIASRETAYDLYAFVLAYDLFQISRHLLDRPCLKFTLRRICPTHPRAPSGRLFATIV